MNKKVLITGANGFIGNNLYENYLEKKTNWKSYGIDIKPTNIKGLYCDFVYDLKKLDIIDYDLWENYDYIFHFACDLGDIKYIKNNEYKIMNNNVIMDMNIIDVCKKYNLKLFYPSSSCVYSPNLIKEDGENIYPIEPENNYGLEKLYIEKALEVSNIDYRIGRFFSVYGPNVSYTGKNARALPALCRKVIEADKEIEIWGDGRQIRSFLYIEDAIDAMITLFNSDVKIPINIGSENPIMIDELVDIIIEISGKNLKKVYNTNEITGASARYCSTKIIKELGWEQKVFLYDGVKETYNWIKRDMMEK